MIGMDRITGQEISGIAYLRQSFEDILSTRKGLRVMVRDYGSELPALIDSPVNREGLLDMYAETAAALRQWENRFEVQNVTAVNAGPGWVELSVTGIYKPEGRTVTIENIVVK